MKAGGWHWGWWLALALVSPAQAWDTVTVVAASEPRYFITDGVVEAVDQGTVSAQTEGRVAKIYVDVNDTVNAGDLLMELTTTEQSASLATQEASVARARAQLAEANNNLNRVKSLLERGTVSKSAYDAALANAQYAQAELDGAVASTKSSAAGLSYTRILAPYAGVVSARHVEVGETVTPGQALLSGFSTDRLRVVADLPQRVATQVGDQEIGITLPDGTRISTADHLLFRYADPVSHSLRLRLNLPPTSLSALFPGGWVKVAIAIGDDKVIRVPRTAVLRKHELSAVYVGSGDNQWQLRPVRLGDERDGQIAILSGLDEGEVISKDAYDVVTAFGGQYAP